MKVKLLGTGAIYSRYNCASLIIDGKILVDVGPGTVKQLIKDKYNLCDIDTILITHLHSDHILDFPSLIVNIEVLKINHKVKILGPKNIRNKLLKLLNLLYGNYFDEFMNKYIEFIEINNSLKEIIIDEYRISIVEVLHNGILTYGYIINDKLGITGDSSICNGVKEIFSKSEVIIADCSLIKGNIYHMGINDIVNLLSKYKDKSVIATHLRDDTRDYLSNNNFDNLSIREDGYFFIVS